jgi:hypothetical protein
VCPSCGSWRSGEMHRRRLLWQCKDCGQQTSATAGTVLHGTHTPLRTWFWAAYLVSTHHPGISAKLSHPGFDGDSDLTPVSWSRSSGIKRRCVVVGVGFRTPSV